MSIYLIKTHVHLFTPKSKFGGNPEILKPFKKLVFEQFILVPKVLSSSSILSERGPWERESEQRGLEKKACCWNNLELIPYPFNFVKLVACFGTDVVVGIA